MYVMKMAHTV